MAKHVKNIGASLLASYRYTPDTGALFRTGISSKYAGPVYIDYNGGRPIFTHCASRYYVHGLVAFLIRGEHIRGGRMHFVDKDVMNFKQANLRFMEDYEKLCPTCGVFYEDKSKQAMAGHYRRRCKPCMRTSGQARMYRLKREFGMTPGCYARLLEMQDYKCAVCGLPEHENTPHKVLAVDHCHTNGRVRGLLCTPCNTGLGLFKDNPRLLLVAAKYLVNSQNND